MSVQFGRWSFDGKQSNPDYMERVARCLAPYGPDSNESHSGLGIEILYRAFHTTKQSRREAQPHICPSGAVITWDGRLDNRDELIDQLKPYVTQEDSDVAFVAAAFERWGTDCFSRLIGDWALSIWSPRYRSLVLAKDPIGPRHLYYSLDDKHVAWSTVLDPLVLFAGKTFRLCEEYIAGCLSFFPATHLTPYVGIHAVPPSTCVFLGPKKHIIAKYWDFDPSDKIRYRTDGEYEEHFRSAFFKAVRRRLRSDTPVLAELSGGRDSSSIVCVADEIIARGDAETPRLDTISYYDDSEPNWNERPYLSTVEDKRGRRGWHIDLAREAHVQKVKTNLADAGQRCFISIPGYDPHTDPRLKNCLVSQCNRVVLSGLGGDETMGGIPTPVPQLENLIRQARFGVLARQLKLWALEKRVPWLFLLFEAMRRFLPIEIAGVPKKIRPPDWAKADFVKQYWAALAGYPSRIKLFGPLPSFQENIMTMDGLRRQLARTAPKLDPPFEKRYPFFDRSLLEFIFSLPPEQLVRSNQRRSLMRRALSGIVPAEILNKKRKSFAARSPQLAIERDWANLMGMTRCLVSGDLGIVEPELLLVGLAKARQGDEVDVVRLMRAISIELWLQGLRQSESVLLEEHARQKHRRYSALVFSTEVRASGGGEIRP